jgi:hypothetical protein
MGRAVGAGERRASERGGGTSSEGLSSTLLEEGTVCDTGPVPNRHKAALSVSSRADSAGGP